MVPEQTFRAWAAQREHARLIVAAAEERRAKLRQMHERVWQAIRALERPAAR